MATLAVFIALGGTAMAAVIITDNSQVAKDTISGHKPPSGVELIGGSVNSTGLANPRPSAWELPVRRASRLDEPI